MYFKSDNSKENFERERVSSLRFAMFEVNTDWNWGQLDPSAALGLQEPDKDAGTIGSLEVPNGGPHAMPLGVSRPVSF